MSEFTVSMARFRQKFLTQNHQLVYELGQMTLGSVRDGSSLTGAPGQPIDEGELVASWKVEYPTPNEALVTTKLGGKAFAIEHGQRAATKARIRALKKIGYFKGMSVRKVQRNQKLKIKLTVRSARGGFHSVKLTRANFGRLVEAARRRVFRS